MYWFNGEARFFVFRAFDLQLLRSSSGAFNAGTTEMVKMTNLKFLLEILYLQNGVF